MWLILITLISSLRDMSIRSLQAGYSLASPLTSPLTCSYVTVTINAHRRRRRDLTRNAVE